MFSNLSETINNIPIDYHAADITLPFTQYIEKNRLLIAERRMDFPQNLANRELIINANSPYELLPTTTQSPPRIGALLIHGLLDSPYSLRDIGSQLQQQGILCRSILLPGHGTVPSDLINISYHDWIQAVRYGVESLRKDVDQVYLVGYSTGATLSVYQALHDKQIAGIILLSPAIKIRAPIDFVVNWQQLSRLFSRNKEWLCREVENDYTKYQSIPFNAAAQVSKLTIVIREILEQRTLQTPIFVVMSREDETVSSHRAIDFFSSLHNNESKMLVYSSLDHAYPDPRIITRVTHYPDLSIKHFSHVSIPFSPNNTHYGQHGDFAYASNISHKNVVYGAYNYVERKIGNSLRYLKLRKNELRELTYNPDFEYMINQISRFIFADNKST